jgi:glutamine synthetase
MEERAVAEWVKKKKINWVQIHFTDVNGGLRIVHMPASRFIQNNVLKTGVGFDGSSVGFRRVDKSDMIALPDASTCLQLPHEPDEMLVTADLYDTTMTPYRAGPRMILKKAIAKANEAGFDTIQISPEMEFYVFDHQENDHLYEVKENQGYFIPPPIDNVKEFRKDLSDRLIESGYQVKYHHHETGKWQHEIEIEALDALSAADFCAYFKYLAREIGSRYGLLVTFMPKPLSAEAGSGMHAHVAFYSKKKNMFLDEKDPYRLSKTGYWAIGGMLDHARGMTALANPTLNSYKRLIPHREAPIYIAWAQYNRSSLIRIAARKNTDVEIRNADPAANPYLFYAALIYAGLDGIQHKRVYEPVNQNIYEMTDREIKKAGILRLPTNLMEALQEFEHDKVIYDGIGKDAAELFIENKTHEWNKYMAEVTDLDYEFYLQC